MEYPPDGSCQFLYVQLYYQYNCFAFGQIHRVEAYSRRNGLTRRMQSPVRRRKCFAPPSVCKVSPFDDVWGKRLRRQIRNRLNLDSGSEEMEIRMKPTGRCLPRGRRTDIRCATGLFSSREFEIARLAQMVALAATSVEKAAWALELVRTAEVLLSCQRYDDDNADCRLCRNFSGLRRTSADLIVKAGTGNRANWPVEHPDAHFVLHP